MLETVATRANRLFLCYILRRAPIIRSACVHHHFIIHE